MLLLVRSRPCKFKSTKIKRQAASELFNGIGELGRRKTPGADVWIRASQPVADIGAIDDVAELLSQRI